MKIINFKSNYGSIIAQTKSEMALDFEQVLFLKLNTKSKFK